MLSALASAAAVYVLFLLLHWIPFRVTEIERRTRAMTLVLAVCLPTVYFWFRLFSAWIPTEIDWSPWAGALFYVAVFFLLWCGYVQFVFSFDTSPSLRVLVVLREHPAGMKESELIETMNFRDTFRRRFQRAVDGGAVIQAEGTETRFRLTASSLRLARIGQAAKRLFRLGVGG